MKRYGIMATHSIQMRETMTRFLQLLGMNHSQESMVLDSVQLEALAGPLEAAEKELREGMGLRPTQRKAGKWNVGNTIDLISVLLESWGGSTVENIVKQKRVDKKAVRFYTLKINENNTIWENIDDYDTNMNEPLIKL